MDIVSGENDDETLLNQVTENARHMSSCKCSEEPSISVVDRVYLFLKGVTVPRYFIENFATEIWKKLLVKSALIKYFYLESFRRKSLHVLETVGRIFVY